MEFFNTRMGRKLVERDVPHFIRQVERLNANLETYLKMQDTSLSVWILRGEEGVLFVCSTSEKAELEQKKLEDKGITSTLSGPHEVVA